MKHGQATWFEIPVTNLERAIKFYNEVLSFKVLKESFSDREFGVFKKEKEGVNGVLLVKENHVPGNGVVLFFYSLV